MLTFRYIRENIYLNILLFIERMVVPTFWAMRRRKEIFKYILFYIYFKVSTSIIENQLKGTQK